MYIDDSLLAAQVREVRVPALECIAWHFHVGRRCSTLSALYFFALDLLTVDVIENNGIERVATFLAILELTRNGRILLDETNTRMTLNRSYTPDEGDEGGENSQFDDIAPEGDDRDDQDILNGQ